MNRWHGLHLQPGGTVQGSDGVLLAGGVNETNLLPGLDLSVGVNIRSMGPRPSRRVDDGTLSYQKRPRHGGTLGVILQTQACVNVVLGGSRAAERCENDAVREGHSTDLKGCEESRGLGGRRHVSQVEGLSLLRDLEGCWKLELVVGVRHISLLVLILPQVPKICVSV